MANESIGGMIQPLCDPCIEGNLTHQNKEGDHGKSIGRKDIKNILGQEVQGQPSSKR